MKGEPGQLALFDSYMAVIENSPGSHLFRNAYFHVDGERVDVLNNGDLSCAVFVTAILKLFDLSPEINTTVHGAIEAMLSSGWNEINEARRGCVFVWESHPGDDGHQHKHIGFCTGPNTAISNNWQNRCPIVHGHDYRGLAIERMLWHPALEQ
jgi:hypothetical protein